MPDRAKKMMEKLAKKINDKEISEDTLEAYVKSSKGIKEVSTSYGVNRDAMTQMKVFMNENKKENTVEQTKIIKMPKNYSGFFLEPDK